MCAAAVQAAVKALPGVSHACASFSKQTLNVEGENLNSGSIIAAIQETGSAIDAEVSAEVSDGASDDGIDDEDSEPPSGGGAATGQSALDELCGAGCACTFKAKSGTAKTVNQQHVFKCPEYAESSEFEEFAELEESSLTTPSAWDNQEHSHAHSHGNAHKSSSSSLFFGAGIKFFSSWDAHKKEAVQLTFSAVLFIIALLWDNFGQNPNIWAVRALFAVPYLLCGWAVFRGAGQAMRHGSFFNEFSLMGLATLAAIGLDQMPEAVGVMLFYRIGEFFQELALNRSRGSIKSLLASRPTLARVLNADGTSKTRAVERVLPGETIIVRPGEKIPLDAEIISGESQFDTAPITGEPKPQTAKPGGQALAGYINLGAVLTLKVSAAFEDSQIARILELVEKAAARKAAPERFVTRFARVYTPIVIGLAVAVACLPPLLGGADWREWIYRALVLLVISCPCALVISIPLSYFSGIGGASRRGILVKGGLVFDTLKDIRTVVFDKTGTLTHGVFEVSRLQPATGVSEQDLLVAAGVAESHSNHPVALSIMQHLAQLKDLPPSDNGPGQAVLEVEELAGKGMIAKHGQDRYLAGNAALLQAHNLDFTEDSGQAQGTLVYVAKNNQYLGCILVSDRLREESAEAIAQLKSRGFKTLMLTGDREQGAAWVAEAIGVDNYRSNLLPSQKVDALEEMVDPKSSAFVGDGVNDAPILTLSGVGIAMGGLGSAVAVEASDVVILNDSPAKVVELFDLGKKVRAVVWQNIVMAVGIKILFMTLGIIGLSGLWEAVFADVGVALLAVLNATRAVQA